MADIDELIDKLQNEAMNAIDKPSPHSLARLACIKQDIRAEFARLLARIDTYERILEMTGESGNKQSVV